MEKISKIYYINLDTRQDRKTHFLQQCAMHNLPIDKVERYSAIDGRTYTLSHDEIRLFKNANYRAEYYANRIYGNQLSHFNILCDMVKNNYQYIIIFQDDVILKNNFSTYMESLVNNIPRDAEIINIGFHKWLFPGTSMPFDLDKNESVSQQDINEDICIIGDTNPGSLAYIVTLQGAKNLIAYFSEVGFLRETDWNYNDYLRNKNIFYGSRTILATGNQHLGSDVFMSSAIENTYISLCNVSSDINEHLPTLYTYAKNCNSVLELGVVCVSSWAFTHGLLSNHNNMPEKKYHVLNDTTCCDVQDLLHKSFGLDINHKCIWKNNLELDFESDLESRSFDLLFIDSWHVYGQLKRELNKYNTIINKYIIMHDTEVDKIYGESIRRNWDVNTQSIQSGIPAEEITKGLSFAIYEFLQTHPEWKVKEQLTNNNGLTILERIYS